MSTRSNAGRAKHFDVRLRYVIELIEAGILRISYISSKNNVADILTHSCDKSKFKENLILLKNRSSYCIIDTNNSGSHSGGDSKYDGSSYPYMSATVITGDETEKIVQFLNLIDINNNV